MLLLSSGSSFGVSKLVLSFEYALAGIDVVLPLQLKHAFALVYLFVFTILGVKHLAFSPN